MGRGLAGLKRVVAAGAARAGWLATATDFYLYLRGARASGRGTTEVDGAGRPLPPAVLRLSSAGTTDPAWFLESGAAAHRVVEGLLDRGGSAGVGTAGVLDFGCGCGRVLRHVEAEDELRWFGVDWNPRAVAWCRRSLPAVRFARCAIAPPLPFPGERFRLIYAFSVFTHLPEPVQSAWLEELASRLVAGGLLALSTHGESYRAALTPAEARLYDAGEIVLRQPSVAGTNVCAAYHPPAAFRRLVPPALEVVEHRPEGALGNPTQDLWVLRRRG